MALVEVAGAQAALCERIEHAKRLLLDADMSLVDVVRESGFANQSHLTQAFKRRLGFTPAALRKAAGIPHVSNNNRKKM